MGEKDARMSTHQWTKEQLRRQVKNAIYRVFDAAKNRDFGVLAAMHYPDENIFSKFDDSSPYKRQSFREALMHEEVAYSNIADFNYTIEDLEIVLLNESQIRSAIDDVRKLATGVGKLKGSNLYELENSATKMIESMVAIATFHLETAGLFVNDYRFEGSPARSKARVSMVFLWKDDQWVIVHEHFSRFPEEQRHEERKKKSSQSSQ